MYFLDSKLDNGATVADWLGTAALAASFGARRITDVREGSMQPARDIADAVESLTQALGELKTVQEHVARLELDRLRGELASLHHDTPEYREVMDRISVAVREQAEARREARRVETPFGPAREPDDDLRECEHKWRDYEMVGVVCRDCGTPAPADVARLVRRDDAAYDPRDADEFGRGLGEVDAMEKPDLDDYDGFAR